MLTYIGHRVTTPCVWSHRTPKTKYPQIWVNGRMMRESRFVWEEAYGPIPDGLHILHHCDNPRCIRLDHLFLGTNADNTADRGIKRRSAVGRVTGNGRKTHCPKGHVYGEENIYWTADGHRRCRVCVLANKRRRWHARKAARC